LCCVWSSDPALRFEENSFLLLSKLVIPAQAGIQASSNILWMPACASMTNGTQFSY
jgi:hypothetical protein